MHDDGVEKRVQSDQRPMEQVKFGSLGIVTPHEVDLDQVHARAFVLDEEHLEVFDGRREDVEWRWGRHSA